MKPTQVTELFANIKNTFVSFFSILMFVALGVGIFLGITWTAPALQGAADKAFDEGSFHDAQIQFVYGLTGADLGRLAEIEGVTDVEGGYQSFQTTVGADGGSMVKLQSMGERIDVLSVVEGELPAANDEVAVIAKAARDLGISVGDTIEFEKDAASSDGAAASESAPATTEVTEATEASGAADGDAAPETAGSPDAPADDGMKYLNGSTYKVTALVNSPEYVATSSSAFGASPSASGSVDLVAWAPASAFDASAFQNGFPVVNVRCEGLQGSGSFSDAYAQQSKAVVDGVSALGDDLATARYDDLHDQAQKRIDDAQAQIDDAKKRIAEGEQQLVDGRAELESRKAAGEAQLASAYQQLIEGEKLKSEGGQLLAEARAIYDEASSALSKIKGKEKVTVAGAKFTAKELKDFMKETKAGLDELQAEYDAKVKELNYGWSRYYAGQAELDAAVAAGEQRLAEGQRQIEEARQQVAQNEPKLADAKEQLASMKRYAWTVLGRSSNVGAVQIDVFSGVTTNLSFSMALLFVIVGLLVSYSAISRIVHEQITQIGTKKALGLRTREITASFLLYAGIAVLLGAAIGAIVGAIVVEGIIGRALGRMFIFGSFPSYFGPAMFAVVTLIELVLVLAATWLACRGILKEQAVELLKGGGPREVKVRFYEKWAGWDKLSPLAQTIVNNCVNDKRRVFSTIVGVAGCTALIVTAVTLNNDVLKSYDRQYEDVYGFNAIAYCDPAVTGSADGAEAAMHDAGGDAAQVMRKSLLMTAPDGSSAAMRVVVPADDEAFARVYHVNPVSDGEVDLAQDGVWVSQACRDHCGAKVGDTLKLAAGDGTVHEVPILGFYEFWLTYNELVMGHDFYAREFGAEPVPNAVLGQAAVADGAVTLDFGGVEGFDSAVDDKTAQYGNFATFSSVSSAVVAIYLVLAALMAVVVLLNLNVMSIEEKKRELIVLMINGFSARDAQRYVYNDTIVLTAIGIACGVALGYASGVATVGSVEPSTATFVKDLDLAAVAIGFAGSAVLAFVMSAISLRRIPRFTLTDINKQG